MIRGTTPTLNFTLPMAASTVTSCNIAFKQGKSIVLEKTKSDCTTPAGNDKVLSLTLTQAETLSFDAQESLLIQMRILVGNVAMASQIITVCVNDIIKDGTITAPPSNE